MSDVPVGLVENEFASVSVRIDGGGNSARLRVEDLRTGEVGFLDPLQLEALVHLAQDRLDRLLDPSADRWRHDA
ncbi:MAG: hypothetical protein ACJ72O_12325 [Marmoricola sp.]|jgi:hypothetical protein